MDFWSELEKQNVKVNIVSVALAGAAVTVGGGLIGGVLGPILGGPIALNSYLAYKVVKWALKERHDEIFSEGHKQGMQDGARVTKEQLISKLEADEDKKYGALILAVHVALYDERISNEEKTEITSVLGDPNSFLEKPHFSKRCEHIWDDFVDFDVIKTEYLYSFSDYEILKMTDFIVDVVRCDEGAEEKSKFLSGVWFPYLEKKGISIDGYVE